MEKPSLADGTATWFDPPVFVGDQMDLFSLFIGMVIGASIGVLVMALLRNGRS